MTGVLLVSAGVVVAFVLGGFFGKKLWDLIKVGVVKLLPWKK